MDFELPVELDRELSAFEQFLDRELTPNLRRWQENGRIGAAFFGALGRGEWFGYRLDGDRAVKTSVLREACLMERLAQRSPGVAIAVLAHIDLGFSALERFGAQELLRYHVPAALAGERIMCLGNTENTAGSDVAGIAMRATKVDGGWRLEGAKAYVTNGAIADLAIVTAVSDPAARRNRRLSMYLVDLTQPGISRKKLDKQAWTPSDLTRLVFKDVFVADDHLVGERGKGLRQVLEVFTRSRAVISALSLGTAQAAFSRALAHARKRRLFDRRLIDFQAKSFEFATHYAELESARLMVYRLCDAIDRGQEFKLLASLAKYLSVKAAQTITPWAADIFGAASVIADHPIHKFPLDAWAAAIGEGTQDIQKLIISREILNSEIY